MCGIAGIYCFSEKGKQFIQKLPAAAAKLALRGPDADGFFYHNNTGLTHRRLSIIDTSAAANQPMVDTTGRYSIIFNGEIFNYLELKVEKLKNILFVTQSDSEVLLQLYIHYGSQCLKWLKGFFAFAIYDKEEETLFIARDNFGKKPLLYYQDDSKFIFASEMKALLAFDIPKEIDYTSLYQYFQLSYIPSPATIFTNVKKLPQGHFVFIKKNNTTIEEYYSITATKQAFVAHQQIKSYDEAQQELLRLMNIAVKRRMIADVPLGAFLSGGIDSSAVVSLAAQHTKNLNTFSIGYKDEPLFDETKYASLVAKKCNTNHTVFSLGNNDFLTHLYSILDYLDEPFADPSCIPTYILCKHTRSKVKVALSGDGGDEVFAGYNKHAAEYQARQKSWKSGLVKSCAPIWKVLPKSRSSKIGNKIRQLHKFAEGANLAVQERYYRWCSIASEEAVLSIFQPQIQHKINLAKFKKRKAAITDCIKNETDFNQILQADMEGVLVSDMVHKVDMMSMANSLEVRSPFLDVDVVNFAFLLPQEYKINRSIKKRIVQDTFRKLLPEELYNRPKQGFDLPLLSWFRKDLYSFIFDDLLTEERIMNQGIFNFSEILKIKAKIDSSNNEDVAEQLWAHIVFQYWWKKNME
jgi:asparagine synthase (glutamine-hydrolysing)